MPHAYMEGSLIHICITQMMNIHVCVCIENVCKYILEVVNGSYLLGRILIPGE